MFKGISLLVLAMSFSAHAEVNGLGFAAPEVTGTANIPNPVAGEIVLDANSPAAFKGFDGSNWLTLGSSSLQNLNVASKTGNYTLVSSDDVVLGDSSSGAFTLTLPAASGSSGKVFHLKKTDSGSNAVTVDGNASETIDGSADLKLSVQNDSVSIVSDGSNWKVVSRVANGFQESSASGATNWPFSASAWGDFTSITLPPGEWLLTGVVIPHTSGAPGSVVTVYAGISTTSGNSGSGLSWGVNEAEGLITNNSGYGMSIVIPAYKVSPTTSTTYYLKGQSNVATNVQYVGYRITAQRIK